MLLMTMQQTCGRDGDTADNNEINMKVIVQSHRFTVLIHSLQHTEQLLCATDKALYANIQRKP